MVDRVDDGVIDYEVEQIPEDDYIFRRVNKCFLNDDGTIKPGLFSNSKPTNEIEKTGMSTDWAKYSSARDTKQRASKPDECEVIKLLVSKVHTIEDQKVEHTPSKYYKNRSHTDVYGRKKAKERMLFLKIYERTTESD